MNKFQEDIKKFKKNGFLIKKIKNIDLVEEIRNLIRKDFSDRDYLDCSSEAYREKVLTTQNKINNLNFQYNLVLDEKDFLSNLISNDLHVQNIVYLRASRPNSEKLKQEQLGFHRETFYSDHEYMKFQHNIWTPILNVTERNSLSYVPQSHLIPDDAIKVQKIEENISGVKRFSNGHKIGLAYMPKKIISGVDFTKVKKLFVPENCYVIFSSMLIHGAAINLEEKIRFSLDFGVLPSEHLTDIKISFAAGKEQFSSLTSFQV